MSLLGVLASSSHSLRVGVGKGGQWLWSELLTVTVTQPSATSSDPIERAAAGASAVSSASTPAAAAAAVTSAADSVVAAVSAGGDAVAATIALDSLATAATSASATDAQSTLRGAMSAVESSALTSTATVVVQGDSVQMVAESVPSTGVVTVPGGAATAQLPTSLAGARVVVSAVQGVHPASAGSDAGVGSVLRLQVSGSSGGRHAAALASGAKLRASIPKELLVPFPCDLRSRSFNETTGQWEEAELLSPLQLPIDVLVGLVVRADGVQGKVEGGDWETLLLEGGAAVARKDAVLVYPDRPTNDACAVAGQLNGTQAGEVELPASGLRQMQVFVAGNVMPATNFGKFASMSFYEQWRNPSIRALIPGAALSGILVLYWFAVVCGYMYDRKQDRALRLRHLEAQALKAADAKLTEKRERKMKSVHDQEMDQSQSVLSPVQRLVASADRLSRPTSVQTVSVSGAVVELEDMEADDRDRATAQEGRQFRRRSSRNLMAQFATRRGSTMSEGKSAGAFGVLADEASPRARSVSFNMQGTAREPEKVDRSELSSDDDARVAVAPLTMTPQTLRLGAGETSSEEALRGVETAVSEEILPVLMSPPKKGTRSPLKASILRRSSDFSPDEGLPGVSVPEDNCTSPKLSRRVVSLRRRQSEAMMRSPLGSPGVGVAGWSSLGSVSAQRAIGAARYTGKKDGLSASSSHGLSRGDTVGSPTFGLAVGSPSLSKFSSASFNNRSGRRGSIRRTTAARSPVGVQEEQEEKPCCAPCRSALNEALIAMKAHTWLCYVFRVGGGQYTRPQRATVLFTFMLTVFFILAVFHGRGQENKSLAKTASAAFLAALMLMPVVVLLQLIFRRARVHVPVLWHQYGTDRWQGKPVLGELLIRVLEAADLPNLDAETEDPDDVTDPYISVVVEDKRWKSATIWNDLNPIWDGRQVVSFPVRDDTADIDITIFDDDGNQDDSMSEVIGGVTLTMGYVKDHLARGDVGSTAVIQDWYDIDGEAVVAAGVPSQVKLIIEYRQYTEPQWESAADKVRHDAAQRGEVVPVPLGLPEGSAPVIAIQSETAGDGLIAAAGSSQEEMIDGALSLLPHGLHVVVHSLRNSSRLKETGAFGEEAAPVQVRLVHEQNKMAGGTSFKSGESPFFNEVFTFDLPRSREVKRRGWLRPGYAPNGTLQLSVVEKRMLLDHVTTNASVRLGPECFDGGMKVFRVHLKKGRSAVSSLSPANSELAVYVKANWPPETTPEGEEMNPVFRALGIDTEQSREQLGTSTKFVLFLFLAHVGLAILSGWYRYPYVFFVVGLFVFLATATYLLLFVRALGLFLVCLALYGCIYLAATGYFTFGVALGYLWLMGVAALVARKAFPDYLVRVMVLYWAGHMAIVLCLYYGVVWWFGVLMALVQFVAAAFFYWLSDYGESWAHLCSLAFVVAWGVQLGFVLHFYDTLALRVKTEVSGTEAVLAPVVFAGLGSLVVLKSYQNARGGLIPQELPHRFIWVGYALAFLLQAIDIFYVLTYTMQEFTVDAQIEFLRGVSICYVQDIVFNEPLKLLLLPALGALAKTVAKSFLGKAVYQVIERIGLVALLKALFS
eukprot:TRINITY_DN4105_c0_g1_i1.p1 TRINITY_DN4105_c0_g1~~TRINITY_DN4105_c0_g1_i1.p1  ORF type:complete len:1799 (+),score=476.87 TRINITY_DN4105_c0_g1_i1:649-5397(+)